jgi:hypothetical protein
MESEYVQDHARNEAMINEYKGKPEDRYMLTIARDGEYPERSIYIYDRAIDAVNGYNEYKDWGFAKHFLTVSLYEPSGSVTTKVLSRPPAGECVFLREQYYDATDAILKIKNKLDEDSYSQLVYDFAKIFSLDSWRFDSERFFENTQCMRKVIE